MLICLADLPPKFNHADPDEGDWSISTNRIAPTLPSSFNRAPIVPLIPDFSFSFSCSLSAAAALSPSFSSALLPAGIRLQALSSLSFHALPTCAPSKYGERFLKRCNSASAASRAGLERTHALKDSLMLDGIDGGV